MFIIHLCRCLIKHLEGLMINYDSTVRDSDGSLVQIYYGEDGLDILKSQFLRAEQLDFLVQNRGAIANEELLSQLKSFSEPKEIAKLARKIRKWQKRNGDPLIKNRQSEFTKFSTEHRNVESSKNREIEAKSGRSIASLRLMKKWFKVDDETKDIYRAQSSECPEPVMVNYRQDLKFGVLSERLESLLEKYIEQKNKSFTTSINKEELRDVLCAKVMSSIGQPGEPVGLLGR